MTRILKVIAVALSLSLFAGTAPVLAAQFLSVTVDNANVRVGPGKNYQVVMELFAGYPLKVLKKQGEWYKVSDYENDSGWIHRSIVRPNNTVIVNAKKSLNMRSGPSTKNKIIADVERGVVLQKLEVKGKWTKVRHDGGTTGWIYNQLLWP